MIDNSRFCSQKLGVHSRSSRQQDELNIKQPSRFCSQKLGVYSRSSQQQDELNIKQPPGD